MGKDSSKLLFFLIVQLTSSEVDRSPAEPLYGPGVVVDDVLLTLGVTPTITRYGRQLAATTTRSIHPSNHRQSAPRVSIEMSEQNFFSGKNTYFN